MAKVTAPLLSIGATGTFGGTITMAKWKGIQYARQRVDPANPNTTEQQSTRTVFAQASASWKTAPADFTAPWQAFAEGRPLTGRNAYIGQYTKNLRGKSDLADWVVSPGARSGQTVQSMSAEAGSSSGEIDVTYTLPPVPTGWTLDQVTVVTAEDQDPSDNWSDTIVVTDDEAANGSVTVANLEAATDYAVGVFLEWTRPDGKKAYGASVTEIATSAA